MDITTTSGTALFRTPYNERYHLVQIFRGLKGGVPGYNCPVSFHSAGLQRSDNPDIWHMDILLSFANDDCVPMGVNRDCIGANHGWPAGLVVYLPGHDKTLADIGSLWRDEAGLEWTLLRIEDEERLFFISENIGESKVLFDFAREATGTLTYVSNGLHTSAVTPLQQHGGHQLNSSNRYQRRSIYAYKNGERKLVYGGASNVDYADIVEVYDIINPATVAKAIRDGRPEGGYTWEPDLAVGEAMLHHEMTYRILSDGTILCIFDVTRLQEVRWSGCMGIMYQEKSDAFGGGVWRVIPTLKPLEIGGQVYDFSVPYNTTGGEFINARLTRDTWVNPDAPPDHQLDFICRPDGSAVSCFMGGYLPVYDGHPSIRGKRIGSAAGIVKSRKTYPNFCGEDAPRTLSLQQTPTMERSHGVGYRRYFAPAQEGCCVNAYAFEGKTYVVMDFYADTENAVTYALPEGAAWEVVSCTGVILDATDRVLVGRGARGSALIAVDQ